MAQNSIIAEFELKREDGTLIDSSEYSGNIDYVEEMGMMAPGIEEALKGLAEGADFDVKLDPEGMFGPRDEENIMRVPSSGFHGNIDELKEGMIIEGETPQGMKIMTVTAIEGDEVVLDANHPLAGLVLNFSGKVLQCRPATEEEIAEIEADRAHGCGCGHDHGDSCGHHEGHDHGDGPCCGGKDAADAEACRSSKKENGDSSSCCGGDCH